MLKKDMPKDRWGIPVPAEMSKSIGLDKGKPVYIDLDKSNNRIILTSSENASDVNLVTSSDNTDKKEYTDEEIIDLIRMIMNENYNIKSGIMDIVLNRKQSINYKVDKKKQEKCGHCNRILKDNERLRVNGKRICSDCKKLEVQKFLLYLERRKLNAKKE